MTDMAVADDECWQCGGTGYVAGCFESCCSGEDCDPEDPETCCSPRLCDICGQNKFDAHRAKG